MNYTSIEQSKKLLNLGLEAESADMSWMNGKYPVCVPYDATLEHANTKEFVYLPCWSTAALFNVLPVLEKDEKFYPFLGKHEEGGYICKYACSEYNGTLHWFINDTQLEACYEMVEYILKNEICNK